MIVFLFAITLISLIGIGCVAMMRILLESTLDTDGKMWHFVLIMFACLLIYLLGIGGLAYVREVKNSEAVEVGNE